MIGDCTVCGYPTLRLEGHADWCDQVRISLAQDPTTWCAVPGCNKVVNATGVYCHLHSVAEAC